MMWFQRHEEPKTITDEFEQVSTIFLFMSKVFFFLKLIVTIWRASLDMFMVRSIRLAEAGFYKFIAIYVIRNDLLT